MNMNSKHGGNIYRKAKELNIPESQILDFSANVNPLGLPDFIRQSLTASIDGVINYPDPDCMELTEALADFHGTPPSFVLCGNGGADLLFRLAYGLRPKRVLLAVPAFVEYEEAMRAGRASIDYYPMGEDLCIHEDLEDRIGEGTDLLVLCNPNNPTGLLTERELIRKLLGRGMETGTRVLVDECFLDLCDDPESYSLIPELKEFPNLLILKSFTKLYAVPGIRLGYLLGSDTDLLAAVRDAGQAWSVSWPAQCAGIAALRERDYRDRVVRLISRERDYMIGELEKMPLKVYRGTANYLFFRAPGMEDLDRRLEDYGIMIRNCSNYVNLGRDYWRVAVRYHEENRRLLKAMREIFQINDKDEEGV